MFALTHLPSPRMADCLRMHADGPPIDAARAVRQHAEYRRMLARAGAAVESLDANLEWPDAVFIEDTAIVLDEAAVLCSMGHPARRGEPAGVEPALRRIREIERIELPATIDGGDVLRIGRRLLVGLSGRTNAAGVEALAAIVRRHGYAVEAVHVPGALHLKSACTALPDGRLLANPAWLGDGVPREFEIVPVPADEPHAANVALVGDTVCAAAGHPRTAEAIRALGFRLETTDLSEFANADGCTTCLSLLFA
ncbi:MAG: arginine deiminase family protein [Planctomycetaceae bacterium]